MFLSLGKLGWSDAWDVLHGAATETVSVPKASVVCLFLFLVIKMKCKRVFTGAAGEKAGGDVDQIQPTERRQVALAAANEFQQLRTVSDDPAELAVAGSDGWYPEKKKRTFSKRYDSIEMRGVLPK